MLGVWSVAHGQLLQSLAADSALEAQAPKAKGGPLSSTDRDHSVVLWGREARQASAGASESS